MRSLPTVPFAPVPLLFLRAPSESDFFTFLDEAHRIVAGEPTILAAIDADLDLHGQRKKALRIQDEQWNQGRNQALPTLDRVPATVPAEALQLGVGRPRTEAYVVYIFLCGRGFFGGFKSSDATTLVLESTTLQVLLSNQGVRLPGRSTLTELANVVSLQTREKILDAQLRAVLHERWDDFKT